MLHRRTFLSFFWPVASLAFTLLACSSSAPSSEAHDADNTRPPSDQSPTSSPATDAGSSISAADVASPDVNDGGVDTSGHVFRTPGAFTMTLDAKCSIAHALVWGGGGGSVGATPGGVGGFAKGTWTIDTRDVRIVVGAGGARPPTANAVAAGAAGVGTIMGAAGGELSLVAVSGAGKPYLVAGGGGGACDGGRGGAGGGPAGTDGLIPGSNMGGPAGKGATQTNAGNNGGGVGLGARGLAGVSGTGGNGGPYVAVDALAGGGGGGAGLYGGGGGAALLYAGYSCGGGGGGSGIAQAVREGELHGAMPDGSPWYDGVDYARNENVAQPGRPGLVSVWCE